ncbi:hypothetical protein V6N13_033058 [Hibiscus sabdariffa]
MVADSNDSDGLIVGGKEQVGSNTMIPLPTSYARLVRKNVDFNIIRGIRSVAIGPTDQATNSYMPRHDGILLNGYDANKTLVVVVLGGEAYAAFTNAVLKVLGNHRGSSENARVVHKDQNKLKVDGIGHWSCSVPLQMKFSWVALLIKYNQTE